jgi:deoxyribodipyrimidine photo-lyase
MSSSPVIHWFRRDLRLSDNSALAAASASGRPVIPVFIFDPALLGSSRVSAARVAFMLKALQALDATLREYGSRLLVRRGDPRTVLPELARATGAMGVYFNRDYSPFARQRDAAVMEALNIPAYGYEDVLILPPGSILKQDGHPFAVFTPFYQRWLSMPKPDRVGTPDRGAFFRFDDEDSHIELNPLPTLADLGFGPTIDLPAASEAEAQRRLHDFIDTRLLHYQQGRNRLAAHPDDDTLHGTSFLSPYLRLGMLSPRQAYTAAHQVYPQAESRDERDSLEQWLSELAWRDFYGHILYHFPYVLQHNFKTAYQDLEWRHAPDELQAWKAGHTGYPVIDAAMRQLQQMGWMPNRARMIVASFLCKDLLIDWREGDRYFMQMLIDGDPASNNGGWQWTAGTGTDAQPYFRIFNPVSQSRKFDPEGAYIRRWLPELRDVPTPFIHEPWRMPTPPRDYPPPMVDHAFARARTLAAFGLARDNQSMTD